MLVDKHRYIWKLHKKEQKKLDRKLKQNKTMPETPFINIKMTQWKEFQHFIDNELMEDASQSPLLQEEGLFRSKCHLQFYRDVIATHLGSFMLGNNEQAHLEFKSKSKEELGNFLKI